MTNTTTAVMTTCVWLNTCKSPVRSRHRPRFGREVTGEVTLLSLGSAVKSLPTDRKSMSSRLRYTTKATIEKTRQSSLEPCTQPAAGWPMDSLPFSMELST